MPKVKVNAGPKVVNYTAPSGSRTGDQSNYGLWTNSSMKFDMNSKELPGSDNVRSGYPEADEEDANVEVEQGEYILSPDLETIYKANGKKHYKGGTPIQAKEGSYVVSDFIRANPDVMDMLGFESSDKKQTWADVLRSKIDPKVYNTLAGIQKDKEAGKSVDPYTFNTAKYNLPDYKVLASKIALGNELSKAMSGKPYNIPGVAQPGMQDLQTPQITEDQNPMFRAKWGGFIPKKQAGGITAYPGDVNPPYDNASLYSTDKWRLFSKQLGFTGTTNKQFQEYMYKNPELQPYIQQLHQQYGQPRNGMYDGLIGHRWDGVISGYNRDHQQGVVPIPRNVGPNFIPPDTLPSNPPNTPIGGGYQPPMSQGPVAPHPDFTKSSANGDLSPNAFDVMGVLNAMTAPINTYYPWAAKPQGAFVNPQFDEPNYYPLQSANRTRMDVMNQSASPTTARAVGSYQPDMVNGIIQETARARGNNLQSYMQAQGANAQTANNISLQDAQIDTDLYNKTVMSKEQRDIAKRLKQQDVSAQGHNLVNNMMQMQYLQSMNPQYRVSGPFWNKISFAGGKSLNSPSSGGATTMTRDQFIAQNPGYAKLLGTADEFKIDDAMRMERLREENMMFKSAGNFNSNMYNPYVASMLNSAGGYPPGLY